MSIHEYSNDVTIVMGGDRHGHWPTSMRVVLYSRESVVSTVCVCVHSYSAHRPSAARFWCPFFVFVGPFYTVQASPPFMPSVDR